MKIKENNTFIIESLGSQNLQRILYSKISNKCLFKTLKWTHSFCCTSFERSTQQLYHMKILEKVNFCFTHFVKKICQNQPFFLI